MGNLERFIIYQRALALSIAIHKAAQRFPRGFAPSLKNQLLRSIESVVSNLAEGAGARSDPERVQFATYSLRSANEAQGQLENARGLKMLPVEEIDAFLKELDEIRAMIFVMRRNIEARMKRPEDSGVDEEEPSP